jgi:DNA invertase Pin-like site-specific DNA recombinase
VGVHSNGAPRPFCLLPLRAPPPRLPVCGSRARPDRSLVRPQALRWVRPDPSEPVPILGLRHLLPGVPVLGEAGRGAAAEGASSRRERPVTGPGESATEARATLYLRVSTEDQDLAGQERELRAECARRKWAVVAVYSEKVTGTGRVERKEHERLLADATQASRPWNHLLVWSLDRWSRDPSFVQAVGSIETLEAAGVRFHSLREPMLDSSEDGTPNMGRDLLRAILPVIASFESRRRSERVRVAMREIKAGRRVTRSGLAPGRPVRVTPEKLAAILRWKAQGLSWRAVAQKVGLPRGTCANAASRVRRGALQNPGVPKGSDRSTETAGVT